MQWYRHVCDNRILVTAPSLFSFLWLLVSPKSFLIRVIFIPVLENAIWRKRTNTTPSLTESYPFQLFFAFRRGLLLCTSEKNKPGIVSVVPPHRFFWHQTEEGKKEPPLHLARNRRPTHVAGSQKKPPKYRGHADSLGLTTLEQTSLGSLPNSVS